MSPSAMSKAPPRHSASCEECQRRNLPCDGQQPRCRACLESGHACEVASRGTRGPKKGYLKALRNRVVYLEAMLEGRMNAQRQRQEQQNMSGSSSTATLPTPPPLDISETAVALDQDQSWLPPVDIPPSEPEKQMPSDGGLLDFGLLADWSLTASVLPPTLNTNTDITDVVQAELYQLYFDRVHPSIPILHHRRYLSWSKSKTKTPAQKCLQYAMWTLATMLSAQYRDLIEPLYLEMKQMLEFLIGQESRHGGCDIELVQASVLVAVFESMRTYHRQAWLSAGRSFRLMQAMRFHTIDDPRARGAATAPTESGDAFIETEEKRRVFWMAYFLDHIFSMRNDWPITLNEHVICTRLPVPDADFQSGQAVVGDFLSEAMTATTLKAPSPFNECLILATICGRGLLRSQRQNISEAYGHMESDWGEQSHWLDSILTTRLHALTQDYPPPTEAYDPLLLFANILSQATVIYYCKGVMESASSPIGSLEANTEILGCQHQASMAAATIIRLANALRDLHFSKIHPLMPIPLFFCAEFLYANWHVHESYTLHLMELVKIFRELQNVNDHNQTYLDLLPQSCLSKSADLLKFGVGAADTG